MTKSQERVINMMASANRSHIMIGDAEIEASKCHVNGEIKEFTIKENNGYIAVYVVLGAANDEGTMAEFCCRDKALLFIGKRGKITIPIWDSKRHEQRYQRYRGIWLACYDYDNNTTKGSTKR